MDQRHLMARSVSGVSIRLTAERWNHISKRHPEVAKLQSSVLAAIRRPQAVYEGNAGSLLAVRPEDDLYLVVIYREVSAEDGFVITAYLTRRLAVGRLIWKL